jgi:cysteinyl-tRNA synthetase
MSTAYLGETFDIHGGGTDLIFPHHECEIAQTEADTGKPFARCWVHNGMVNFGAEKMSKSLGNILTIKNLLGRHDPEALRFHLLNAHYRAPVEFSEARLGDDRRGLGHLKILVGRTFHLAAGASVPFAEPADDEVRESSIRDRLETLVGDELHQHVAEHFGRFLRGMDDDFNTAQARAALSEMSSVLNRYRDSGIAGKRLTRFLVGVQILFALGRSLGLLYRHVNPYAISAEARAAADQLVEAREEARRQRDWRRGDEIREQIDSMGFVVEDTPAGPRLRWKGAPAD